MPLQHTLSCSIRKLHFATKEAFVGKLQVFMNNEFKNFLNWNLRGINWLYSILFFVRKGFEKLISSSEKEKLQQYPSTIRNLIPKKCDIPLMESPLIDRPTKEQKITLKLASKEVHLTTGKDINWKESFHDKENSESLHRWNWIIYLLADSASNETKDWIKRQVSLWLNQFSKEVCNKLRLNPKPARWESYSIAERLSNYSLFITLTNTVPKEEDVRLLSFGADFLSHNLEYNGPFTGNHVFNNARGLYLYSLISKKNGLQKFAREIIKREYPILTQGHSILREGSSHYQLLFTRWCIEIFKFAKDHHDEEAINFFRDEIIALRKSCSFFKVNDEFPLFGDISPDFTPEWLIEKWGRLLNEDLFYGNDFPKSINNEWFRIENVNFSLINRSYSKTAPTYVGHHHDDNLHFSLFFKGIPLFVDTGRKNYVSDDPEGIFGITSQAHNSISINHLGSFPIRRTIFPKEYFQNNVVVKQENASLEITTNSFNRISPSIQVKRIFSLAEYQFDIVDQIKTQKEVEVIFHFHIDSGFNVNLSSDKKTIHLLSNGQSFFMYPDSKISSIEIIQDGYEAKRFYRYGKAKRGTLIRLQVYLSQAESFKHTLKTQEMA